MGKSMDVDLENITSVSNKKHVLGKHVQNEVARGDVNSTVKGYADNYVARSSSKPLWNKKMDLTVAVVTAREVISKQRQE